LHYIIIRLVDPKDLNRSVNDLPESLTTLMECPKPSKQPVSSLHRAFGLFSEQEIPITLHQDEYAWLFARTLIREQSSGVDVAGDIEGNQVMQVPVWSAYNSLINDVLPVTRVGAPPLLAAPAHEWNTLLTVLMQARNISTKIVGSERKTVISLDMGLYLPAKKLQMARDDLGHLILRPGELHIVMAMLRTIGAYMENSGLDMCWTESELYGPSTVKQILDGNHVKRGQRAHMTTLQALFMLYLEAFCKVPETHLVLQNVVKELADACTNGTKAQVQKAHANMTNRIQSHGILERMSEFDAAQCQNPMFVVMRQYMRMVMEMLAFIRAVRTGDWGLHLAALEMFTAYFFAHDRYNYARMIPLYLAEMASLSESDPEIYEEFQQGNWIVNKNAQVAFCAVGADHALEHINRSMKVSGGLVGITLNESARAKFFLIAPELARLAEQANTLAGLSSNHSRHHHNLTAADIQREEKRIEQLTSTIKIFTNPFSDHTDLFNLVTKVVMTENAKKDLCQQRDIGRQLFECYVKDRIQSGKVNLWATMKKRKLLTWKSSGKTAKLSTPDKIVELQEDRSLFARMMMVCKSRPEIDIKEAVGQYEFSIVPRSLFAADGTMLHCSLKSSLMGILEKLHDNSTANANEDQQTATRVKVSIVDAMAEVQSLDKPEWIRNCSQLAEHFNNRIFHKYNDCDEVRVIFDRYDLPTSLKAATRDKRQSGQVPIYYRITDTTQIAKVPMKKLLSHIKTKMELTAYLGGKLIEYGENNGKQLVVAYGCEYQATHKDVQYLRSNQEEADTKMILHAVDASRHGATEVNIHSPDTDVFILAIRRYTELCEHTLFVTGRGLNHRVIPLKPIVQALGNAKTAALPAFHALSGADNTGIFAGRGKLVCWKAFQAADTHVISALCNLGTTVMPCQDTITDIEKFVCQLYQPKTNITTVKELRWFLFRKKQAQSDRLPPTQAALYEAILRSHYQLMVWNNDIVPNPQLPSPQNYGWKMDEDHWLPVMTKLPPAPEAIIQLVKCGCVKERCSTNRCQCRKAGLSCTDLCTCSDTESCENGQEDEEDNVLESGGDDDDDDSDGFDELQ